MAVSVIQPVQQRQQVQEKQVEKDPLDMILKGLNIATSIYGIKHSIDQSDLAKLQQNKLEQATQEATKKAAMMENPEMPVNVLARQYSKELGYDAPGTATASQLGMDVGRLSEIKATNLYKPKDETSAMLKQLRVEQMQADAKGKSEKAAFEKTPEGKLSKMGAAEKQRLDNATLAVKSVQGMADALAKGENTFSLIGDNPFTQQRTQFEEALGRMQSGGAISKEEELRFKKMAPTLMDSAEIRQQKINDLNAEMIKRIGTMGFKPEELGLEVKDVSKSIPKSRGLADFLTGGLTPSANANANKPPVIQNGQQYIWNPQAGKYE